MKIETEDGTDLFDQLEIWRSAPEQAHAAWLARQRLRDSTKTVYTAMFGRYCQWLREQGKQLERCDAEDIRLFLDTPNPNAQRGQKPQTTRQRQQYVRQLQRIFEHLGELGHRGINPGRKAAVERVGEGQDKPTRFLSEEESAAVITAIGDELQRLKAEPEGASSWMAWRDLALIAVLLGAGLKVGDIARLNREHVSMTRNEIELGNTRNIHRAAIRAFAREPIRCWLDLQAAMHGAGCPAQHPLFEADRSSGFGRLSDTLFMHASSVHRRTQRFLHQVGITGERASAQTLRNTYAAMLIEEGCSDDELVQRLGLIAAISAQRLRAACARSRKSVPTVVRPALPGTPAGTD